MVSPGQRCGGRSMRPKNLGKVTMFVENPPPSRTPLFVFFSVAYLCMPIAASAHGIEDVSFTGDGLSAAFATAISAEKIPIGQTFIPNANNLVGLDLKFATGQSAGVRTVTVEIREGGILGNIVGQTTDTFNVPGTGPFFHHFDFDPPVPLTPGLTHAIQVPLVDISLAGSSSTDPMDPLLYPDGAFFQGGFGGPEPGGATFIPQMDLNFVTLPEPSTALLHASAFATLAALALRRRGL